MVWLRHGCRSAKVEQDANPERSHFRHKAEELSVTWGVLGVPRGDGRASPFGRSVSAEAHDFSKRSLHRHMPIPVALNGHHFVKHFFAL